MFKRIGILLCAALLALTGTALHLTNAKPVHAIGACGSLFDIDNVSYTDSDGYRSTYQFVIGADGNPHQLNIDLQTYHMSQNGICYRGAYVSTWFQNHEYGFHSPEVNVWTNYGGTLRGPWTFTRPFSWDWGNYVWTRWGGGSGYPDCTTCSQLGPWAGLNGAVTLPNGARVLMDFGNVQFSPRDRKANSTGTIVHDCNSLGDGVCHFFVESVSGGTWWVQIWEGGG